MNKRVLSDAYRLQFSFTLHFTQRPIKESVMLKPPEMYKKVVGGQNIFSIFNFNRTTCSNGSTWGGGGYYNINDIQGYRITT